MRNNIINLINSGITAHTVAVDTGIPRNTVYRIFNGEAKVDNITLKNAEILNAYYMDKFGYIEETIKGFETGKVEIDSMDPDFFEMEYKDGPSAEWIIHKVEGYDLELVFAEHDFVKDLRQQIYNGDVEKLELENMLYNEYSDRFDYDNVAGYRVDGGKIVWL